MPSVQNIARELQQGEIALGLGLQHLQSIAARKLTAAARHDRLFMNMKH